MKNYKNWQLTIDVENIAWLGLDRHDVSVNTINDEVLDELYSILQEIGQSKEIIGLVIYSAKEKGFIAGADIKTFSQFSKAQEAVSFLRKGHTVLDRLEDLSIPTVAIKLTNCLHTFKRKR